MIVEHFWKWVRNAAPGERAEATTALAGAFLHSHLDPKDRAAIADAMMLLLEDSSPLVRQALAEALAPSPDAPRSVIYALAADLPQVARAVVARSPLISDDDLVDIIARSGTMVQCAAAGRRPLRAAPAAALAEVGEASACVVLLQNDAASIPGFSFDRMIERFGHVAEVRTALAARENLPITSRQKLVTRVAQMLVGFTVARGWLDDAAAARILRETCERTTVALVAVAEIDDLPELMTHLRVTGQLTAGLILRALLSGNAPVVEAALAELTGLAPHVVRAMLWQNGGAGVRALHGRSGLPGSMLPALRAAIAFLRHSERTDGAREPSQLDRRLVERVLEAGEEQGWAASGTLRSTLRRLAAEAAREEAREVCRRLAAA